MVQIRAGQPQTRIAQASPGRALQPNTRLPQHSHDMMSPFPPPKALGAAEQLGSTPTAPASWVQPFLEA